MFELRIGNSVVSVETAAEIQAFIDAGRATAETPIRKLGGTKWSKLQHVKGLKLPEKLALPTESTRPKKGSMPDPDVPHIGDIGRKSIARTSTAAIFRIPFAIWVLLGVGVSTIAIGVVFLMVSGSNWDAITPKAIFEEQVLLDLSDVPSERIFWKKKRDDIEITQVFWTPLTWDLVETSSQRYPLTARVEHHTSVAVYDVKKHNIGLDEARSIVMKTSPTRVNVRSQLDIISQEYSVILTNDYGLKWNGDTVDAPLIEVFRRMANFVDRKTKSREYREKNRNTTREHKRNLEWIPCNVNGVEVMVLCRSFYSETVWMWDLENSKWEQQPGETSLYPYTDELASHKSFDSENEIKLNSL